MMRTPATLSPTPVVPLFLSVVRQLAEVGGRRAMRLHCHQHGEKPALFVAEISGNSTTAFSLLRWRAGWWNNTLRFSGNSLQISLCEARDSPLSTGTQSSGLGWCRHQLPRWQLCTCQIILQPVDPGACLCSPFPDSRQVLSSSAATEAKIFFFSLLWCLFAICAVNVPSQFTPADGEQPLASHLTLRANYWTPVATTAFQPPDGLRCICAAPGELHSHKEFLWGCLTVNTDAPSRPGYRRGREDPLQSSYSYLWKLTVVTQTKLPALTIRNTGQILLVFLAPLIWSWQECFTLSR